MRGRFVDLVERQIALFTAENEGLIRDTEAALGAYNRAPGAGRGPASGGAGEEAEECSGAWLDLAAAGTEGPAKLGNNLARSLKKTTYKETPQASTGTARKGLPPGRAHG